MRYLTVLALAAGLCGMAGCAFTDIPLDMPISGLSVPVRGGNGRQVVVNRPFADQRHQPGRCGMQKNGYGWDTANVVCSAPPADWLAEVLADELRAAGFTVVAPGADHKAGALLLDGTVLQLFVEPVPGMWSVSCEADLEARLVATSETGLRAERQFFVKGEWRGFAGVTGPFQVAMKDGSEKLLREMVEAVLELMNRYPQLGWRRQTPVEATCAS